MTENEIAMRVTDLSKCYRIGLKDKMQDNLSGAMLDFIKSPLKNYRRYRSLYTFSEIGGGAVDAADIIWALRDVSFEVRQGEALGIIGRNGAGKSTLLKVLSRITDPSGGQAEIRGKVSSLLEVGTGFHQELTGRENVYLNGTILGMKKKEVDHKFDEIVEFSGVEKFIDTPVKRYSSGMKVRLAFSVAAHLEPDILIVDEVLAVGDADFQKKCMGKMEYVAKEGRTVLFVSHNMAAIEKLCDRTILLHDGKVAAEGQTKEVLEVYLQRVADLSVCSLEKRKDRRGAGEIIATAIEFMDRDFSPIEMPSSGRDVVIRVKYRSKVNKVFTNCRVSLVLLKDERPYINLSTELADTSRLDLSGDGYVDFLIPEFPLSGGNYYLTSFIESNQLIQDWVHAAVAMPVEDGDFYGTGRNYPPGWRGKSVLVKFRWQSGELSS